MRAPYLVCASLRGRKTRAARSAAYRRQPIRPAGRARARPTELHVGAAVRPRYATVTTQPNNTPTRVLAPLPQVLSTATAAPPRSTCVCLWLRAHPPSRRQPTPRSLCSLSGETALRFFILRTRISTQLCLYPRGKKWPWPSDACRRRWLGSPSTGAAWIESPLRALLQHR